MSFNVILTCDGVRLMTITSVFMRLSLSWYFVKAVFQVGIRFSGSSFMAAVYAMSSAYASINCLSLSFIP